MPSLRALFGNLDAPVDFGVIRPWVQRIRGVGAIAVVAACAVAVAAGFPAALLPGAAAAVVAVHAFTRGRRAGSPTESLLLDALGLVVGFSQIAHIDLVLVAAAAYLVSAGMTFGGARTVAIVMTGFLGATAVRELVGPAPPESTETTVVLWLAALSLLAGMAVSLLVSTSAVAAARVRQEQALVAERRAAEIKTEFVSMVTHELRTPLTNIAGFAMTMRDAWRDLSAEEADEFLRIIVGEAEHLANLVEDVLAIPRLEAGRLLVEATDFPLQPAAFRITDLIFPAGGDRSASVALSGRVRVHADPNRVEQILRNLLENARKYGGDEIRVDATPNGDEWVVVVADNGPGVPAEHRERIFGAFEQGSGGDDRTSSGFGLGLAVARHLVEAMGGRIWYEPGFPVGARFCFTLPAAADKPGNAEAAA